MPHRPERIRIIHELGKSQSLAEGIDQFDRYGKGSVTLLLGVGPAPAIARKAVEELLSPPATAPVFYLECPAFAAQMPPRWHAALPNHWQPIPADGASLASIPRNASVLAYRPGIRLFPSFWGPLLATAQWAHLLRRGPAALSCPAFTKKDSPENVSGPAMPQPVVILPGRPDGLLIRELEYAFSGEGCHVRVTDPDTLAHTLPPTLVELAARSPRQADTQPDTVTTPSAPVLFFSVNFQGLDPFGERYHLLRAAGVEVAAWCVDTPWHILSGCKAPYWKLLPLFVTDATFLPGLREAGARFVHHLPLATDPDLFSLVSSCEKNVRGGPSPAVEHSKRPAPGHTDPTGHPHAQPCTPPRALSRSVVFVGRSEFPHRQRYFSGISSKPELREAALSLLARGERPDYHWWAKHAPHVAMWPDTPRQIGAGADDMTRHWRVACLEQAAACGLVVFGDTAWHTMVAGLQDLRPPVDYYTQLPAIYREAEVVLNITGMLLPGGLTQRHFDVWAAGGLLLTDWTPGLDIFPHQLTDAVCFHRAADIPFRVNHLRANPHHAASLRTLWREHILTNHTYRHRVRHIISTVFPTH